jgi:hypothetical protein
MLRRFNKFSATQTSRRGSRNDEIQQGYGPQIVPKGTKTPKQEFEIAA